MVIINNFRIIITMTIDKLIFLDNDGVICLSNNWGSRYSKRKRFLRKNPMVTTDDLESQFKFDDFDRKSINILNDIIRETDCDIVVSSDWKLHANLDELSQYYLSQGLIKRPIACTPNMEIFDPESNDSHMFRRTLATKREIEIDKFLNDNDVNKWVAVDDLGMFNLVNFVHCPLENEGIKQCNIKEKILEFLK